MTEEYVSREEFENLKEEVKEIKKEMTESSKLLQEIDKKIDVINEKIVTADKIENLKINPLEERVKNLEENRKWITRTVLGEVIAIIFTVVVYVLQLMK